MKIYISGKISGIDHSKAKVKFARCRYNTYFRCVSEFGKHIVIVNPFDINPLFGIKNGYSI